MAYPVTSPIPRPSRYWPRTGRTLAFGKSDGEARKRVTVRRARRTSSMRAIARELAEEEARAMASMRGTGLVYHMLEHKKEKEH